MSVFSASRAAARDSGMPSLGDSGQSKNGPASQCAPQAPREDCGYFGIQQPECEGRGCCWFPVTAAATALGAAGTVGSNLSLSGTSSTIGSTSGSASEVGGAASGSGNDAPWCFFPNGQQQQPVYSVESVEAVDPGGATTRLLLRLRPGTSSQPHLGPDFQLLSVEVQQQAPHRLYIRVQPADAPTDLSSLAEQRQQRRQQGQQQQRRAGSAAAGSTAAGRAAGSEQRWRVPEELLPRSPPPSAPPTDPRYSLHLPAPGEDFSLRVTRATGPTAASSAATPSANAAADPGSDAPGDVLLSLGGGGGGGSGSGGSGGCLVFKPQYIQLQADVAPEVNLYGMGETTQAEGLRLRRDGSSRALWNSDTPAAAVGVNLYGSHPVLYGIAPGGAAFGWFLANSNAMDFTAGSSDVTFRTTGGVLELYVFAGPSPEAVVAQYQEVVGRPAMPPRWALGFHQSKYGYGSVDELVEVAASYDAARIPLDVVWSDIDYTDRARMFTLDPQHYPQDRLRAFVDDLHARGRRWVPIVDCGITALPGAGYVPYERGLSYDVFIKDSTGKPLVGQVWSGPTHWPDFLHPNATPYWTQLLAELHDMVPYDGLWLDMNEPSNFCTGECRQPATSPEPRPHADAAGVGGSGVGGDAAVATAVADAVAETASAAAAAAAASERPAGPLGISCVLECTQPSTSDPLSNPPYRVNNGNRRAPLFTNTLPLNAVGYGGVRQYDAHNLYALAESRVTHAALTNVLPGARPFILTRSSWAGQGRYAAHWSGDNAASWDDLRRSVGSLLASSLAGMATAGADICGFMGASNEALCARWLAAGAFYTFARDHSNLGSPPQEPYRWPAAAEAARNALRARYTLLPYLYTAFYLAHTRGGTVARPLAWAAPDPTDPRVADASRQWLLGDALLVAPVLDPDTEWVEVHFPGPVRRDGEAAGGGTWCRFDNLGDCYTGPSKHRIQSPLGAAPPLFLRSGFVVPTQANPNAMTTAAAAASPLTLTALLSAADGGGATPPADDWVARGLLYADNGTDPGVGGPQTLRACMAAGASLAAGSGWFEYKVESAPQAPAEGGGLLLPVGAVAAEPVAGGGAAAGFHGGADVDVRLLRVGSVVVVGAPLPPGCSQVVVMLGGTQLPPGQVVLDASSHVLTVRGLELSAVQSFKLTWQPRAASEFGMGPGTATGFVQ